MYPWLNFTIAQLVINYVHVCTSRNETLNNLNFFLMGKYYGIKVFQLYYFLDYFKSFCLICSDIIVRGLPIFVMSNFLYLKNLPFFTKNRQFFFFSFGKWYFGLLSNWVSFDYVARSRDDDYCIRYLECFPRLVISLNGIPIRTELRNFKNIIGFSFVKTNNFLETDKFYTPANTDSMVSVAYYLRLICSLYDNSVLIKKSYFYSFFFWRKNILTFWKKSKSWVLNLLRNYNQIRKKRSSAARRYMKRLKYISGLITFYGRRQIYDLLLFFKLKRLIKNKNKKILFSFDDFIYWTNSWFKRKGSLMIANYYKNYISLLNFSNITIFSKKIKSYRNYSSMLLKCKKFFIRRRILKFKSFYYLPFWFTKDLVKRVKNFFNSILPVFSFYIKENLDNCLYIDYFKFNLKNLQKFFWSLFKDVVVEKWWENGESTFYIRKLKKFKYILESFGKKPVERFLYLISDLSLKNFFLNVFNDNKYVLFEHSKLNFYTFESTLYFLKRWFRLCKQKKASAESFFLWLDHSDNMIFEKNICFSIFLADYFRGCFKEKHKLGVANFIKTKGKKILKVSKKKIVEDVERGQDMTLHRFKFFMAYGWGLPKAKEAYKQQKKNENMLKFIRRFSYSGNNKRRGRGLNHKFKK